MNWRDENQRDRAGIDLRGADLRELDLRRLPLTGMLGGPTDEQFDDWLGEFYAGMFPPWPRPIRTSVSANERMERASAGLERAEAAAVHLEGSTLTDSHLEDACLNNAYLENTVALRAHFERAHLNFVGLVGANLHEAHFEGARLRNVAFAGADLTEAHLEGAVLRNADLGAKKTDDGILSPATLQGAHFSSTTQLHGLVLGDKAHGYARLADVHWDGVNLSVVDWKDVGTIGEEVVQINREVDRASALKMLYSDYEDWGFWHRLAIGLLRPLVIHFFVELQRAKLLSVAVRTYRQLSVTLRYQGLTETADRFAYRAQVLDRRVHRKQGDWFRAVGSLLLDLVSGYGYRPLRSVITYLLVVALFGLAYWALGVQTGHTLTWNEASVVSLTAFHGRGFFSTAFKPGDPQAALAAIEAVIGLLIEITFIATFTQRFFAR